MGLRAAVSHVPIAQWLAAIQEVTLQNPKLDDALRDRLEGAIAAAQSKQTDLLNAVMAQV